MSKIKSLQYLLLDTLSKRENYNLKNLASTLNVKEKDTNYIISWKVKNDIKEIKVEKSKFSFYVRNDLENDKQDLSKLLSSNNKNAKIIVDKILEEKKIDIQKLNFFKKYTSHIIIMAISLLILMFFSKLENKLIPVAIIFTLIFDIIEKKKIIFYIIILSISLFKSNEFVLFYSLFLIFFNFLEPIFFLKKTKIILLSISIILNFYFLDLSFINLNIHFVIIFLLSTLITLINFTKYNSNYNWIYCLPSYSFGFLSYDEITISYLWIFSFTESV